jgi:hypothetical protein
MKREENIRIFVANRWETILKVLGEIKNDGLTKHIHRHWEKSVIFEMQRGHYNDAASIASTIEDKVKEFKREVFPITPCPVCNKDVKVKLRISCKVCCDCGTVI